MRVAEHDLYRAKDRLPRSTRGRMLRAGLTVLGPLYGGHVMTCPVCSRSSRSFPGGWCPSCAAHRRQRLLVLLSFDRLRTGDRLLHFGPELALRRWFRRLPIDYVPADLDPAPDVERVDMTDIRLSLRFDAAIASHVLEHIPDDRAALAETYRVLRPGAWALLLVPQHAPGATEEDPSITDPRERERLYGQFDHVRNYGADFIDRVRDAGFDVHEERPARRYDPRFGLNPDERVYVAVRPG